jgi:hypothetical protein
MKPVSFRTMKTIVSKLQKPMPLLLEADFSLMMRPRAFEVFPNAVRNSLKMNEC